MPKSLEQRDAAWNRRALTAAQQQGQAAPPIAPVGVETIREAFDEISGLCRHLRQGGPVPEDLQDLSDALHEAVGIAANMLHALAQHPAAGDGAVGTVTRVGSFEVQEHRIELDPEFDERLNYMPEGTVVRLYAAPVRDLTKQQLAAASAALAAPAAEDDPDAAARAYAARMGDRWEHMGEEARQRARELAAQRLEPPL